MDFTAETIIKVVMSGLSYAGTLAMLSVGLTLIVGVLRVMNFAHGALLMVAMYATYWFFTLFNIDPFLGLLITIPLLFGLGVGMQKFLISPLKTHENQVLVTFMFAVLLESLALLFWSSDYRVVETSYSGINIHFLGTGISLLRLTMIVVALAIVGGLHIFVTQTKMGKSIWALAQDPEAATLVGINIHRLQWFTFGLGTAIIAIAGAFLSQLLATFPHVGFHFVIIAFVVVVLGGFGSIGGALLASFIIGFITVFSSVFIGIGYSELVVFSLFIVILVLRPAGLFGKVSL